jgi:D-sedoheptulose 7-phosphate isomerase
VNYIEELQQVLSRLDIAPLLGFVRGCQGTLWLAGNGGSASTAQHWACDLSKAAKRRVQALGSNPAVLTAYANDVSYGAALARELETVARPDDALLMISCSGRSANITMLMDAASQLHIPRMLLSAKNAPTYIGVPTIRVPHTHYGIIEDCHLAMGHWLTEALCSR